MDEFLRQFLMFLAASADDPAPAGGGSNGDEAGTGDETPPSEDPQPSEPSDEELGEGGKKALQAEREARKQAEKRVAELEAQLAQVGSANEAALKEAQEVAKKAQEDLAQATLNASRYKVAGRFGISTEVAEGEEKSQAEMLLTGATEEEMISQAKIIAALRQSAQDDALVDPTQGGGAGGGRQKVEHEPGTPRLAAAIDTQIQK
jgi:multidrug efflux pump subunit AcrA (membrane-fusion protein)